MIDHLAGSQLPPQDREIRLFISSTFRDMHADREALVKHVFPPLRQAAAEAGVAWSEVDLRWGITDEEKLSGRVLELCLNEAARSRVFVLLLGERYGWVPGSADLPPDFLERHPHFAVHPGISATEMEVRHVLNQPNPQQVVLVFLRDPGYRPPGSAIDPDPGRDRLSALKVELRQRANRGEITLVEPYRDPAHLAELSADALSRLVRERFLPQRAGDPLAEDAHDHVAALHRQVYVARREVFDLLDRLTTPVVITGPAGAGKTALLCNWTAHHLGRTSPGFRFVGRPASWFRRVFRQSKSADPRTWVFLHLATASPRGGTWAALAYRLLAGLKARFAIPRPLPDRPHTLQSALPGWLALAAAKGPILLVLDGLDELQDADPVAAISWLPEEWPASVRVIISARPGRVLDALTSRGWRAVELGPLSADEREAVATAHLGRFGKKLSPALLDRVRTSPALGNPFTLRTVLDEVRVFGIHEDLPDYLSGWVQAAAGGTVINRVTDRLGADYDEARPRLVRDTLELLAASRRGLTEGELRELLAGPGSDPLPSVVWAPFFAALREFLVGFDGVWTFAHTEWRTAAERSSASGGPSPGQRLAEYFTAQSATPRSLEELPWQLVRLADWPGLGRLFADPGYLPAGWQRSPPEVRAYFAAFAAATDPEPFLAGVLTALHPHVPQTRVIVELFVSTGRTVVATALAERLVAVCRAGRDPDPLRDALGLLTVVRLAAGNLSDAARLLDEQAGLIPEGDPGRRAANLTTRAAVRDQLREPEVALGLLVEAERLYAQAGDEIGLGDVIGNRAVILYRQGNADTARRLLQELEDRCRVNGNLTGLQKALGNRAVIEATRDPRVALRLHAEEERLCRRLHDPADLYVSLANQTRLLTAEADYDGAIIKSRQAVAVARDLRQVAAEVTALLLQAEVYLRAGLSAEAAGPCRMAAELATRHGLTSERERIAAFARRLGPD